MLASALQDRQPPFVFRNCTASAVEVGIFLPQPDDSGGFQYEFPAAATTVGAGCRRQTAMKPMGREHDDSHAGTSGVSAMYHKMKIELSKVPQMILTGSGSCLYCNVCIGRVTISA